MTQTGSRAAELGRAAPSLPAAVLGHLAQPAPVTIFVFPGQSRVPAWPWGRATGSILSFWSFLVNRHEADGMQAAPAPSPRAMRTGHGAEGATARLLGDTLPRDSQSSGTSRCWRGEVMARNGAGTAWVTPADLEQTKVTLLAERKWGNRLRDGKTPS